LIDSDLNVVEERSGSIAESEAEGLYNLAQEEMICTNESG